MIDWTRAQHLLLACSVGLLLLGMVHPTTAQPSETHGVVSQKSGSQVVVQLDSSLALPDSARGRVYPEGVTTSASAAEIVVKSVSGSLVIAEISSPPGQGSVQSGQNVTFAVLQNRRPDRAKGTVNIESAPGGVTVRLVGGAATDGRELGQTPVITKLPAGQHRLRFRKSGHVPLERVVEVAADSIQSVSVSLRSLRRTAVTEKGTLVVRPSPSQASVFVNDEEVGAGRVETAVDEGDHRIRASASGHQSQTREVRVEAGERREVALELSPETGQLRIVSAPEQALVSISGDTLGRTPLTVDRPAGRDTLQLDKFGYESVRRAVRVAGGITQNVDVELRLAVNVEAAPHGESKASNVRLEREGNQVRIQYALSGGEGPYAVEAQYSSDGGETYEEIPQSYLSGDIGEDVSPGPAKEIRWAALQQYSDGLSGNGNRVRVLAEVAESDRYPARPGLLVEFQYTGGGFQIQNAGGETVAGASVGGMRARLGYAFKSATLAFRMQKAGLSAVGGRLDGSSQTTSTASTWAFGPEIGALIVDQGSSWPIAIYSGQSYLYSRAETASGLGYTANYTTHRFMTHLRAYHAFSLSRTFDIVPEIRYTATDFSITQVEAQGYSSTTTNFTSGSLRGALGFYIGTSDFGVHLAGTTNFVFYAVRAELRF